MNKAERLQDESSRNLEIAIDRALEECQRTIDNTIREVERDIREASAKGNMFLKTYIKNFTKKPVVEKLERDGFYVKVYPRICGDNAPFTKPYESKIYVSWKPREISKASRSSKLMRFLRHNMWINWFNVGVGILYSIVFGMAFLVCCGLFL